METLFSKKRIVKNILICMMGISLTACGENIFNNLGSSDVQGLNNSGSSDVQGLNDSGSSDVQGHNDSGSSDVQGLNDSGSSDVQGLNNSGSSDVQGLNDSGSSDVQGLNDSGSSDVQGLNDSGSSDVQGLNNSGSSDVQGLNDSGSSDVQGLKIPSSISVITTNDTANTSKSLRDTHLKTTRDIADTSSFSPNSEYNTDQAYIRIGFFPQKVVDEIINPTLCELHQTAPDKMVNKGAYYAVVIPEKCIKNQPSSTKTIQKWIIESTRADNNSPMIVKFWIEVSSSDPSSQDSKQSIGKLVVTQSPSATNPIGVFTFDYKYSDTFDSIYDTGAGRITVQTEQNKPKIQIVKKFNLTDSTDSSNNTNSTLQATIKLNDGTAKTGGQAYIKENYNPYINEYKTVYNENYIHTFSTYKTTYIQTTHSHQNDICQTRMQTTDQVFDNQYNYNLYYLSGAKAGERVRLNNIDLPFSYIGSDGRIHKDGYAYYYGIEPDNLPEGTTVTGLDDNQKYTIAKDETTNKLYLQDSNGQRVPFDQPLDFNYTLTQTDERNGDPNHEAGNNYNLSYNGNYLLGIPSSDPGFYPPFNLKDGVKLVDTNGTDYVVKAIIIDKVFNIADASNCSTLDAVSLDSTLGLPELSSATGPDFTWNDKPQPSNDQPAVIEGVVQ